MKPLPLQGSGVLLTLLEGRVSTSMAWNDDAGEVFLLMYWVLYHSNICLSQASFCN